MEEKNNEIDLIELSRNIMVRLYHYCLRRYKLLGIFAAIGFFLGISFYRMNKEQYESKIIATSHVVSSEIIIDIINSLGDINRNDKELASKILKLNIEEVNNFNDIKADTILSIKGVKPKIIEVSIKFKRSFDMTKFSKKLSAYIDSSEYVKNELRMEKMRINSMLKKYNEEIKNLDSLQKNILKSSLQTSNSNPGGLLIFNDKSNSFFHNDIVALETSRQEALSQLERLTGFYVIDQKAGLKEKQVSIVALAIKYTGILLGIGFLITIVLEFIRQVKRIELERNVNKE